MIAMTAVTVRRAWATVTRPPKVIDGLFEPCRAIAAGALGELPLAGVNIEGRPMLPFTCRSIRIIAEKDEAAGRCRSSLPVERWREVLPIAGELSLGFPIRSGRQLSSEP